MNKNTLEENNAKFTNANSPSNKKFKKDKLNGYFGKFKYVKNEKSNPEFKSSAQILRTAHRGQIKNKRLIQSGKIQIKNHKYNQEIDGQSYLTKFLEIATKKKILTKKSTDEKCKTNERILRNTRTIQRK